MANIKISHKLLTQLRKSLHKHPELSGKEKETARRIRGFLKSFNPSKIIGGIGGNGVAAVYKYYNSSPTILFRCELDALPIEETNTFEHRSVNPGKAHKCGHDGHMAIVAGLATLLSKTRPRKGRIVLLFQPAEEDGSGAEKVINDDKFKEIEPDYVFALHNLPGYSKNEIICKSGIFTAAVISMIIQLHGRTSHAGEPEKGINPALAIAEILQKIHTLEKTSNTKDFTSITPIQIQMGTEAYGTSAGYAEMKLTLRTWDNIKLDKLITEVEKHVIDIARMHKLKVDIGWTQSFSSNKNDMEMTEVVQKAAVMNGFNYIENTEPFRWGEDFGYFTTKYKGAMFCIGAGEKTPALHSPDYDFPDDIIPVGIKMYKSIIDLLLK